MASYRQLPNRTWIFRYRPTPGGPEFQVRRDDNGQPFESKKEAQLYHAAITTARASGTYIDPKLGRETFNSFFVRWSYDQPWATSTRAAYAVALKCVTFADVPLRDINVQHIDRWVAKMTRDGLAASTRKTRMRNIKAVFKGAGPEGHKVIMANPMANVKMPGKRAAPTIHEVQRDEIPEPTGGPTDVVVGGGEGWQHAYPRSDLAGGTVRLQVVEVVSERSE